MEPEQEVPYTAIFKDREADYVNKLNTFGNNPCQGKEKDRIFIKSSIFALHMDFSVLN